MFFTSRYLLQQHEKKHIQKMKHAARDVADAYQETDTIKICVAFECTFMGCRVIRKSPREILEHYIAEHSGIVVLDSEEIGL